VDGAPPVLLNRAPTFVNTALTTRLAGVIQLLLAWSR